MVPLFLVRNKSLLCIHKLGEWTGQLWQDNSRRLGTHEKNVGETVCRLGTIKHFLCPIRSRYLLEFSEIVWWESLPRGSSALTWIENFRPAFFPDPTDCPWVSEDRTWLDLHFLNQQHKICLWLYFQTVDLWKTFFYIPTASRETFAQGKINVKTYDACKKSRLQYSYRLLTLHWTEQAS